MIAGFRFVVLASVAAVLTGCATTSVPEPNLGLYKHQLTQWYDSGGYERAFAAAAKSGADTINYRILHRDPQAKIAVVFDIDETLLSNWAYLKHRNFGVSVESFHEWVPGHNDPALVPTQSIYLAAKKAGIPIFLITGRRENMRAETIRQLNAAGFSGWTHLYMRSPSYALASVVPYKSGKRREITQQGYKIILNMGDQFSDLEGGFAEKTVKLPNPYYYIP